jgi:tripartite-type tricarboxylate transporter receptor subunit TctC
MLGSRLAPWMLLIGAFCAAPALGQPSSLAQTCQGRAMKIIVPYAPGGGTDTLARLFARAMTPDLEVSIIVDNQPGGASIRGTQAIARAHPDGCTIGMVDAAFSINAALVPDLPYNTLKDFTPISLIATSPLILLVPASSRAKSLDDVLKMARASPGTITYASAGVGTSGHLAFEKLSNTTGIKLVHVPYKGAGPAVTDLVGGHVDLALISPAAVIEQIKAGSLRPLAVTSAQRLSLLPAVPTFSELGYGGIDMVSMWGFVGPAGLAPNVLSAISTGISAHLKDPEIVRTADDLGMLVDGGSPQAFSDFLAKDIKGWAELIKLADVKRQ